MMDERNQQLQQKAIAAPAFAKYPAPAFFLPTTNTFYCSASQAIEAQDGK